MLYVNGQPFVSILAGNVNGNSKNITSMGNITFITGAVLASGGTNGNTLLLKANDTTFITFTTGATDVCTLAGVTLSGTILASGTVTLPAITLGSTVSANAQSILNIGDRTFGAATLGSVVSDAGYWIQRGATSSGKGPIITMYGVDHANAGRWDFGTGNLAGDADVTRLSFSGQVATATATWSAVYHVGLKYGLAGTATGAFTMDGATSGVVTVTVAAAAGTWTMTLPTGVAGVGGYQLADAAGDGVCSWTAAASLRELKDIIGQHSPQDALDKILHTRVYDFHYKESKGTGDKDTLYTGILADEAPWAMHYKGSIVNPVNTLGYMVLGFQAHEERIKELEDELKLLKAGRA